MKKLAGGHDFVAAPRLSPDGTQLAWVAWDHPNMPWDDTFLYLAKVDEDGGLSNVHQVCLTLFTHQNNKRFCSTKVKKRKNY